MRESLKSFKNYIPEPDLYDIKLDANENPYEHSEAFLQELRNSITSKNLIRYPDTDATQLVGAIAKYWKVEPSNVVCGVGSDQLIDGITKLLLEPGDVGLIPNPSFSMYKHSITLNHGKAVEFNLTLDFDYDVEYMIDLYLEYNPKFIIICSPNNPTGNVVTRENLKKLLSKVECPVILDEAYAEFTNETAIDLVQNHENLIVLRTFSKSYGIAGVRVGYAISSQETINAIKLCVPPYNLNFFSQHAAIQSINGIEDYRKYIVTLKLNKEKLYHILYSNKLVEKVFPSQANFLLVKFKEQGIAIKLKEKSILVRDFSNHPLLNNCLRITVGTEEEINKLQEALNELL